MAKECTLTPHQCTLYDSIFQYVLPVDVDGKRIKDKRLATSQVDYNDYDAYNGVLKANYIYIDVDNKDGSTEGTRNWHRLLIDLDLYDEFNIKNPITLAHSTKSGGFHLFFKLPSGVSKDTLVTKLADCIEIKTKEAFLPNSYVTVKYVGGYYKALNTNEVKEIPITLLLKTIKTTNDSETKKSKKKKHCPQ